MITRPMLAGVVKDNNLASLSYPLIASPKIDGIRCLYPHGLGPVTRNFKRIANKHIRDILTNILPEGFDGEIIIPGKPFNEVVSAVMSFEGKPDFEYHAFDFVENNIIEPFEDRIRGCSMKVHHINSQYIKRVSHVVLKNPEQLENYEHVCLSLGYEGVMIRKPNGRYKCGRSTSNEGLLLKLKRFSEDEAIITGCSEALENNNPKTKDAFGLTKRFFRQANKIGKCALGSFTVSYKGVRFNVGSGFTDEERFNYWIIRDTLIGKTITFRYQSSGIKDKPRFPIFKGFREDI